MPKIESLILRSLNPSAQRRYYCDILGMTEFEDGTVGYTDREARLSFVQADRDYAPTPTDLYWKIAIAVPNIELAHHQLTARGVSVGPPRQFEDIGYLAHFTDPEGFTIELIEHWFLGERKEDYADSALLGGGAHLNLLTLRCNSITDIVATFEQWNMTPLSIQPVKEHNFTLHFFAFTDERPPSEDLYAIENRTWLYRRPYTVLEIQHLPSATNIRKPEYGCAGYERIEISGLTNTVQNDDLLIYCMLNP